jgi:multidrug efflux pump subunit AcrB
VAYRRAATWTIVHRKLTLTAVLVLLAASLLLIRGQKPSFFPKDLSYHFYVDVWTAEDASFSTTAAAATRAERIVIDTAKSLSTDLSKPSRESPNVLRSLLTFVGGSGPRFWFSISPELQQLNYAQIVVETTDKHATKTFAALLQKALDARMLDARADVRELETGKPVGIPIAIRFSGPEIAPLRAIAERAKAVLRSIPEATRIRDDWGAETLAIPVAVHANRANSTGMTTQDVILSTLAASNGRRVGTVHQQDRDIPILLRQDPYTHAGIEGLDRLYVFSNNGGARVPLRHVASLGLTLQPEKLRRRNHERTVTVGAFPAEGQLASRVLSKAQPALDELVRNLPPGYHMEIGGEKESQAKGFAQVTHAMLISILLIYLALVCEFRSAAKPLVVFAAIPFGVAGALLSLRATGLPFGFMAFLGIASLIGVVVSHIIVLFDFIEDAREGGMPLKEALLDAGLLRLRPVLITVGATVLGLVPLAFHGGPLWEPLCLAQIGGLTIATLVTLLLVPALYTCFVHDLGLIRWTPGSHDELDSHPRGRSDAKTA